jgi:Family of unknown function (DUF6056)
MQAGYLTLSLVAIWVGRKKGAAWSNKTTTLLISSVWIATLLALLFLVISPSIKYRLDKAPHPGLINFVLLSVRGAAKFILESIKGLPVPTTFSFLAFFALPYIIAPNQASLKPLLTRRYLTLVALIATTCYILIVCSIAPSGYAQSSYPELRALILARFVMVTTIALIGVLTGQKAREWLAFSRNRATSLSTSPNLWVNLAVIALLGMICVYPLYAARNIYSEIPRYHKWATFWDERDRFIRQARQNGILDIEVIQIDHIIPDVGDLSDNPEYWYNNCAAEYYAVHSITANQPGWND